MSKMLAAVLHDFDKLVLEDVPMPTPKEPGDVVVKIVSTGICATDYKAIKGIRRNVKFPFIPGHEPAGIVAAIGPGVVHFKEGDEVICQPSGYCGYCKHCRVGNTHYCDHAFTTGGDGPEDVWAGSFAQYMRTKEQCLFAKPKNISFEAAGLTEPLSGAWKGVVQYSQMRLADDTVVIGVGSIGLLCMMVAKAAGAGRLIAIDPSAHARQMALKLGATHAIDPFDGDTKRKVYDIIPDGPDFVIEAAGPIQAVKLMVSLLRRGTKWNVFGITTHEKFELDGGLTHFLEARMDASFGTTPLAMQNAIRLMETGLVDTQKIITHKFPLTKIHEGLEMMASPNSNKVCILP
ncbi:MAG: alcohol dehydrogenase catalytic domain-containing protein [Phycisphaeraceae bacterium]|nr:alcohol dehydrogenase catalytic domain-containing protein [Phycisphaeraceae bacterium]